MPKIKTSELTDAALDWAVAEAEGISRVTEAGFYTEYANPNVTGAKPVLLQFPRGYSPSTRWAQGGPIIEREKISIRQWTNVPVVHAYMPFDGAEWSEDGASPLIAAMRCYCSSKLGDVVDIPEELCQQQKS